MVGNGEALRPHPPPRRIFAPIPSLPQLLLLLLAAPLAASAQPRSREARCSGPAIHQTAPRLIGTGAAAETEAALLRVRQTPAVLLAVSC